MRWTGNELYEIHIKRFGDEQSKESIDIIRQCGSDIVWGNDDSTIFYTKLDDELRAYQIWLHTIGSFTFRPRLLTFLSVSLTVSP